MDVVAKEAEEYAMDHTTPMSALLEEVEHYTLTNTAYPSMFTGRVEGPVPSVSGSIVLCTAHSGYRNLYWLLGSCHGGGPSRWRRNTDHRA